MLGLQKQHHSDLNAYKISLYLSLKAMESNVQEPYYHTKNVQFFQFRGDGLEWGWTHPILQPSSMGEYFMGTGNSSPRKSFYASDHSHGRIFAGTVSGDVLLV